MAGVHITASVGGGGAGDIASDIAGDLVTALEDEGYEWVVVHGPHACGPCLANKDPKNVPCAQCTGNRAGHGDDPDGDEDDQFQCQCRVKLRKKDGGDLNDDDLGFVEHL